MSDQIAELASEIADSLMTNGCGAKAERLVLWRDSDQRDLGGLCQSALAKSIAEKLRERGVTVGKPVEDTRMSADEQCICHRCIKEHGIKAPGSQFLLSSTRMILCPKCGNKRCPHASDHRLECTGSNAVGQEGSIFQ